MKILFIHQNFPGQFKFLAPALVKQGHEVFAMTMTAKSPAVKDWQGVKMLPYKASRGSTPNVHPWVADFETKVIRGEACFRAALKLKESGFIPDVVVAHHGWGESMFLKEVWPTTKVGLYCEFFYKVQGADTGFDPEFPDTDPGDICRLKLKNLNNLMHFEFADAGISPTHWQASTFPEAFSEKISVIHDGIDTQVVCPNPNVSLNLKKADELILLAKEDKKNISGNTILISVYDEVNKKYIVASKECYITTSASTVNPLDITYYVNYQLYIDYYNNS